MKDIQACIDFANENKLCFLATVENDQPRVRAMEFWFADETGFYFQTGTIKELTGHIATNPKIEVCFYHAAFPVGTMLRVAGNAESIDDRDMKARAIADRPFLKDMGLTADSPHLILFKIAHGEAYFWTWETNLQPKEKIIF
jgi:uncharacterized pyridoxamine 5'-phosphate oxidase family protein